jgi:hypothetical protein
MAVKNANNLSGFLLNIHQQIQQFNSSRNPRSNALLIAGAILLGGFMTYNVVSQSLTQVASRSTGPAVATPKLSLTPTISPTSSMYYRGE